MKLSTLDKKVMTFYENMCNVYRDEGAKEETCKEDFATDLTEDMTALLLGAYVLYKNLTGSEEDLIGFTHVLNRLAIQHCTEKWGSDGKENDE